MEDMLECEGRWGGDVERGMGDVGKCVGVEGRCVLGRGVGVRKSAGGRCVTRNVCMGSAQARKRWRFWEVEVGGLGSRSWGRVG